MEIQVCDAICGAGKTQSCIHLMNEDLEHNYIFITPYLNEVERIKTSCASKNFISPERTYKNGFSKLQDVHSLLKAKRNIASTHALFSSYTDETISLIKEGNYVLILDETLDLFQQAEIDKEDVNYILKHQTAVKDGIQISWAEDDYKGSAFNEIKNMSKSKNLIEYGGNLYFWQIPIDVFKSFTEAYVLTYMFEYQLLKYYFGINEIKYKLIGTKNHNGIYEFCLIEEMDRRKNLKDKIHVLTSSKHNIVGNETVALSMGWFERALDEEEQPKIELLKNSLYNLFRRTTNADDRMWTTMKKYKSLIKGKGYTNGFIPFNARATNEFSNKHYLAFCLNVYLQPWKRNYLVRLGAKNVNQDMYALSVLIQWVFRSAIRKGEDIYVYIPSRRMRRLFIKWLDNLYKGKDIEEIVYLKNRREAYNLADLEAKRNKKKRRKKKQNEEL